MKLPRVAVIAMLATAACSEADADGSRQDAAATTGPLAADESTAQQRTEAVATMQRLFDALETGDGDLLRSVVDSSIVMRFSETLDGETTFGSATLDGLATRVSSSDVPLIERMWDPIVGLRGPLATIFTPYDFYADTTFSHCGVDGASLLRGEDGWKIVALSWTRLQPPGCELNPDGPPSR